MRGSFFLAEIIALTCVETKSRFLTASKRWTGSMSVMFCAVLPVLLVTTLQL